MAGPLVPPVAEEDTAIMDLPEQWLNKSFEEILSYRLDAWFTSSNPTPEINYESIRGRRSYASNIAGAYYAVRLPVLEYLRQIRRQAGVIVLMEVYPDWIPLGVWRFREICREALKRMPVRVGTLEEALSEMSTRLRLDLEKWFEKSEILRSFKAQTRLTSFMDT